MLRFLVFVLSTSLPLLTSLKLVVYSDAHLDIVYDPYISSSSYCISRPMFADFAVLNDTFAPEGRLGCNSPISLIQSSLKKLQQELDKNEDQTTIVLIPGDVISQSIEFLKDDQGKINPDYNQQMIEHTLSTFFNLIEQFVPQAKVFYTLGNSDNFQDYAPPTDKTKKVLYNLYKQYIQKISKSQLDLEIYDQTATYSSTVSNYLIININSNYFINESSKTEHRQNANLILNWLKQKLHEISNQKHLNAILNYHIPLGLY